MGHQSYVRRTSRLCTGPTARLNLEKWAFPCHLFVGPSILCRRVEMNSDIEMLRLLKTSCPD